MFTNMLLTEVLLSRGLIINPSPGDGHCLLHSVVSSCFYQLQINIKMTGLMTGIFSEISNHASLYLGFLEAPRNTSTYLMHYLRMYLDCKAYNTALGDLFPTSMANSLKLNVHILNKRNGQIEDRLIESIAFNCKTLYIFRNGDHFDGVRPSGTQQPVTKNRSQKLSSPKTDASLFNNHRRETFQACGTVPSTAVARDGSKSNRRVTGAVTVLDVATTPVPGTNVKSHTPPQGVRVPEQMPGTTVTVNTPPMGGKGVQGRGGVPLHLMEDQQLPSVCPARVQPSGTGPVRRYTRQELLNIKPAHLKRSARKMLFSLQLWQPSGTKQMMTNEPSARSQTQTDFHSRESGNISVTTCIVSRFFKDRTNGKKYL